MSKVIIIENICDYIIEFNNNSLIAKPKTPIDKGQISKGQISKESLHKQINMECDIECNIESDIECNIESNIKSKILCDEYLFRDINSRIKNKQNIGLILNHFIKNDKLTHMEYIKIRDNYKSGFNNGRNGIIFNLQLNKVNNPWLKKYQMKYGNMIFEKKNESSIMLTDNWRFIMNRYNMTYN